MNTNLKKCLPHIVTVLVIILLLISLPIILSTSCNKNKITGATGSSTFIWKLPENK